ncbi:hypothetical protein HJFPF1_05275 [Paramyrothecium foliicola]|nr:hypothetical protein HJFPF1_05275 [Paramyrothecium foliicola]
MSRLPPAEKLPLVVRKNIRDEWESKKSEFESDLSTLLEETWTIDVNPSQLYPYGDENSYARNSTGSMISEYISAAISRLKDFISRYGEDVKKEINAIAHAHVITIDVDVDKKFTYNGCSVSSGQLVILFGRDYLGTNIYDALDTQKLADALNEAPGPDELPLSFVVRRSIKSDYDAEIGPVQEKIKALLQKELVLDPNFAEAFAKLKAASNPQDRWEQNFGNFIHLYFSGFAKALEYQKFGDDDMMREAFHEAVEFGKVVFRVVDDGQMKQTYNESVIEDGVLYLQTVPQYFGANVDDIASKLVDLL